MLKYVDQKSFLFISTPWHPDADVYEDEGEVTIVVDIAGVDANHLKITLEGQSISIAGVRQNPAPSRLVKIHQMEIDAGVFSRRIRLPGSVFFDRSRCNYKNGLLTIVLPKSSKDRVVHIPIESE